MTLPNIGSFCVLTSHSPAPIMRARDCMMISLQREKSCSSTHLSSAEGRVLEINIFCEQCEVIMEETVNVQTVVQYWEAASRSDKNQSTISIIKINTGKSFLQNTYSEDSGVTFLAVLVFLGYFAK